MDRDWRFLRGFLRGFTIQVVHALIKDLHRLVYSIPSVRVDREIKYFSTHLSIRRGTAEEHEKGKKATAHTTEKAILSHDSLSVQENFMHAQRIRRPAQVLARLGAP